MNPSFQSLFKYITTDWHTLIVPAAILLLTLLAGFVLRNILFRILRRWQAKSSGHIADILIESLRGPVIIWALIFGIYFALESSDMPTRFEHYFSKSLFALWIISFTVMATHLAGSLVKFYGRRNGGEMPATSLTKNLVQIGVSCIGVAILLRHLGISITPLVTALGVGGLAVALALQDTLSNLFGGFYVTIAGQVRLGDYIKLNTGEEGYVVDISWRSTTLRMLSNNMIIVPNSKLGQAIVTNFHLPEKQLRVSVSVGVSSDSDPDRIESVLLDIAKGAAADVPGISTDPQFQVRLDPGLGDYSMLFKLQLSVDEFSQQYLVQHELRKRIIKRFREEKIDMPFPTQTVFVKGDLDRS